MAQICEFWSEFELFDTEWLGLLLLPVMVKLPVPLVTDAALITVSLVESVNKSQSQSDKLMFYF